MSDLADNIEIAILCIVASGFVMILAGAVWLLLSTLRIASIPGDGDEGAAGQDYLSAQMHQELTPEGYYDREGYGAVGIRVDTNLIRKAWTADGREVDYLSD